MHPLSITQCNNIANESIYLSQSTENPLHTKWSFVYFRICLFLLQSMYTFRSWFPSQILCIKLAIFVTWPSCPFLNFDVLEASATMTGVVSDCNGLLFKDLVFSKRHSINLASLKSALRKILEFIYADCTIMRSTRVCSILFHSYCANRSKRTMKRLCWAISSTM